MTPVIITIGASGIIAQLVLVRELLVIYQGNELSIGIILANWLIAEALGSFLFRNIKISPKSYKSLIYSFAIIFPIICVVAKLLKPILGIIPGEIISFPVMFASSLVILLPVSFLHGALFTSSVSILTPARYPLQNKIPGKVYFLENIGTIIGGIIISLLLIPNFSVLQIAFGLGIINILSVLVLSRPIRFIRDLPNYFLMGLFIILLFYSNKIDLWTLGKNYPNYNIIISTNTIYSNLTVIKREEQYIYLVDGVPTIITPYPDQAFVEDFVNFPMLIHNNPKRVLLISGGAGGVLTQMLKYPIQEIDYVELDPYLIKTLRRYTTELTNQELNDSRVNIINTDARFFLEKQNNKYDLILVSFLAPLSLQTNRFFTAEFYTLCKGKLNQDGVLVTLTPGSLNYISPTIRSIINSHINTLEKVFANLFIIPGDYNLYLSSVGNLLNRSADSINQRLQANRITTNLFNLNYIKYRTQSHFRVWLDKSLTADKNTATINYDGKPLGLFYSLFHSNTVANPSLKTLFTFVRSLNLAAIIIILLLVFVVLFLFRKKLMRSAYLSFAIFSTGVVAMIFTLVISLGFQIRYGFLYYQINLLLTTFITGIACGGYLSNNFLSKNRKYFIIIEFSIVAMIIIIVLTLRNQAYPKIFGTYIDFFIFLFVSGSLVGLEFPLANKITNINNPATAVGKLYAADLLGGFIGAITISLILIPILGILNTLVIAIILKLISVLLILTAPRFSIE